MSNDNVAHNKNHLVNLAADPPPPSPFKKIKVYQPIYNTSIYKPTEFRLSIYSYDLLLETIILKKLTSKAFFTLSGHLKCKCTKNANLSSSAPYDKRGIKLYVLGAEMEFSRYSK